jgi:hypothetical protein
MSFDIAFTSGERRVNKPSFERAPLPGNSTGQIFMTWGKQFDQLRKIDASAPAYGKQNNRRRSRRFIFE